MTDDWFEELFGFAELPYEETKRRIDVVGTVVVSKINGKSYGIRVLETPSLGELRKRAQAASGRYRGPLKVSIVVGDVSAMHRDPANSGAMFQVASQFNLLEMTGPEVEPEAGVTRYIYDRTQGPACAVAAGAGTVYRNYWAPVDGKTGQARDRQIDCLRDLGIALGNGDRSLWTMRNGYALCTQAGLASITRTLQGCDDSARDALRDLLRIGLHWNVQVTTAQPPLYVSQAFCAALPVAYTSLPADRWDAFARLVLEGAYEATLWAAVLNAEQFSSNRVFLTALGGGAFGNDRRWIHDAMRRAFTIVADVSLDVRVVSYGSPSRELARLVAEFA